MNQTTFVLIKPDAVEAGNVGNIISAFESMGFAITYMYQEFAHDRSFWHRFYSDLQVTITPDQYDAHIKFMSSGPFIVLGLNGEDAVHRVRLTIGATDPQKAAAFTIRGRFGTALPRNAVHASATEQAALSEAAFFFSGALAL